MKKLIFLPMLLIIGCATASTPLERMERNKALSDSELCWEIFMGSGEERREQETEALDRGTNCILYADEIAEKRRKQIAMGRALLALGNSIQANSAASVDTSGLIDYGRKSGTIGHLSGQQVSGFNRICYYNVVGTTKVLNVASTALCPLTHTF